MQICFFKREFPIFVFVVIITVLESVHSKLISCESLGTVSLRMFYFIYILYFIFRQ